MSTTAADWWTRVLAIIAIIVSVVTAIITYFAWQSQSAGLEQAQDQFLESGPGITATEIDVSIWGPPDQGPVDAEFEWKSQTSGTNIDFQHMKSPYNVCLISTFTNQGRMRGSIQDAGVAGKSGDLLSPGKRTLCPSAEGPLEACTFPIWIEPDDRAVLYIPVDSSLEDDLQCDSRGSTPLAVAFDIPHGGTQIAATSVGAAWSAYCPELPVPTTVPTTG